MTDHRRDPFPVRHSVAATLLGLLLAALLALGIYFAVYGTSAFRGRVALHNQQRSAAAQQFNYEYFHDTCHAVITATQQLGTLRTQLAQATAAPAGSDPFGQHQSRVDQLNSDISGLSNIRDATAQEYNSRSHQYTRDFVKSKDLPAEIGPPNGVAYDQLNCEGTQP